MKRIAVHIPLRLPLDVVRSYIKEYADDASVAQAYYKLRGTTNPTRVVESGPTRLTIFEPAFDPTVRGHGIFNTGWTVAYELTEEGASETTVEISVEYGRLTAMMGFGLIKPQAEGEIMQRISALLAFERGYYVDRPQEPAGVAHPQARLLGRLDHLVVHLLPALLYHLLDPARVDPPVRH